MIKKVNDEVLQIDFGGKRFLFEENDISYIEIPPDGKPEDYLEELTKRRHYKASDKQKFFTPMPFPKAIVVNVTHRCCIKCTYCFVREYYSEMESHAKFETIKKFLDKYTNTTPNPQYGNKRDPISIGFFGGEPTMNMKCITEVVNYAKTMYHQPKFGVTTNAVLFNTKVAHISNKTIAGYFMSENFSGIISIDGPEGAHDEFRVFANGKGTHKLVMDGLNAIKDSPMSKSVTLRGTFSASIVNSKFSLKDRLQFMNELVWSGRGGHVSLEPVNLTEASCIDKSKDGVGIKDSDVTDALADQYLEATRWYIEMAKAGKRPYWHNIDKFVERIFYGNISITECGAGFGYMGINGKGEITSCHREMNSALGHVDYGISELERAKWVDNRLYSRAFCPDCSIRYICGGGCREESIGEFKSTMDSNLAIKIPVKTQCKLKEIMFQCALLVIAEVPYWVSQNIRNPRMKPMQKMPVSQVKNRIEKNIRDMRTGDNV